MASDKSKPKRHPFLRFTIVGAVVVAAVFLPLWLRLRWNPVVAYVIGITVATFLLYGYDKLAAVREFKTRIPEATLHLFELCGGTIGAVLGQLLFRHKTLKRSFRAIFWLILVTQLAALAAYLYWRWQGPATG